MIHPELKNEESVEVFHLREDGTKGWIAGRVESVGSRTYLIAFRGNRTVRVHKLSDLLRRPGS